MEASTVSEIVEREIADDWSRSNAHGVDLKKCLIQPPEKSFYLDSFTKQPVELWLVLDEIPGTQDGYTIVYGEERKMFGLAIKSVEGEQTFLGYYGTFLETLECM